MCPNSCSLPDRSEADDAVMTRLLAAHRIAIVGLSDDPSRTSFGVARYLMSAGKEIVPVNPNVKSFLGLKSYSTLAEVPGSIDLVNVFRRSEFCADMVRDAIAIGAKGVWLQSGIVNSEAKALAARAQIDFVQNRCIMVEHAFRRGR